MRTLCRLDEWPPGTSRGFGPAPGGFVGLFGVRALDGSGPYVYVNSCPHIGVSLDWTQGQVLTRDRRQIVCATHGALFTIETGECVDGPCIGDRLERVPVTMRDGWILVPENAGL